MSEVKIEDLKKLAKQRDQQAIIAYCVERDGTVRCVTYGEDKLKCDAAGWWGQGFVKNLSTIPFFTIFGWGNAGEPGKLSRSDRLKAISMQIPRKFLGPINIKEKS